MKWLLPLLLALSVSILLWSHQRNNQKDTKYQAIRKNMHRLKTRLQPKAVIGCNVDSNHIREFYECRYWLAPNKLVANRPGMDTQLIIVTQDDRHVQTKGFYRNADTLVRIKDSYSSYYLLSTHP